jgi:hypothetical protein
MLRHSRTIFRRLENGHSHIDSPAFAVYNDFMDRFPAPLEFLAHRQTIAWLLVPVLFLPVGITILFLFARTFALLTDTISASVLDWTALVLCILWFLSLVLLLLCVVFRLLLEEEE